MKLEKPFTKGPDFEHFQKVIMREATGGPVPNIELAVDAEIMAEVTGIDFPAENLLKLITLGPNPTREAVEAGMKLMELSLAFAETVGYDFVTMIPIYPLQRTGMQTAENPKQEGKVRAWQDEHHGLITTREEFDQFPWPTPEQVSILPVEYAGAKMPEGMKVMVFAFGIFEDLKILMGFEQMAIKSIDEPDLLDDILERLTGLCETAIEKAAAHPATGVIFYAEDMGFNSSTMLSPKWMREHVIPRHKRLADACHKHGKPFLIHSCGQIDALMEDLIETVGIDGRHSYQDNIEPVEKVYEKYGDRISILGGVDVDLLARATEDQVRKRTREILDFCGPGGGFCIGSGNSVTNFCKIENYYAMLDETMKWNREHS